MLSALKEAGITWIHKVATIKHLKRAERLGADAIIVVGLCLPIDVSECTII